jgi:DNA-binding transcriptional regulator YhcF (GntR family)
MELDRRDDLPVGVNLAWRLRALIVSGRLAPGARLPGVRELAAGMSVNANTARAVYRRLEAEGLVTSRQGQGTFVAPGAAAPAVEELATAAAEAARDAGVDPRDLARVLYTGSDPAAPEDLDGLDAALVEGEAGVSPSGEVDVPALEGGDETAARRALRDQIARLEWSLAAHPEAAAAGESGALPVPEPGRLVDIAELERTRDDLIVRLRAARGEAERSGERQGVARERLEAMLADPAGHKWDTVSDSELGEPGCRKYEVQPALGPVGALMNWWRVKVSGGCPLAG